MMWIKHYKNGFGSPQRRQRALYAYRVALVLTGGRDVCPNCERPLDLSARECDVDRTNGSERDANGSEIYRAGSIVYLCGRCNKRRGDLQSVGKDWSRVSEYQAAVRAASESVAVPSLTEARVWWPTRPGTARDDTAGRWE